MSADYIAKDNCVVFVHVELFMHNLYGNSMVVKYEERAA